MPLKEKSFKFPIGVATKYNVPFELMIYSPFKILIYTSIISLFLSCTSVGDKNFEEFKGFDDIVSNEDFIIFFINFFD